MIDIETQIRMLAERRVAETSPVTWTGEPLPDPEAEWKRRVWLLAAAAVVVLLAIVGAVLLATDGDNADPSEVITDPPDTTATPEPTAEPEIEAGIGPATWDLVAAFQPEQGPLDAGFIAGVEELAAEVREWPGVTDVVVMVDVGTFTDALGPEQSDCTPDSGEPCEPGMAIRTVDDQTTATVGLRIRNDPYADVRIRPEVAAARVSEFLATQVNELGPIPEFDTGPLGDEQFLTEFPAESAGTWAQMGIEDMASDSAALFEAFGVLLEDSTVPDQQFAAAVAVPNVDEFDPAQAGSFDWVPELDAALFLGTIDEPPSGPQGVAPLVYPNDSSYPLGEVMPAQIAEASYRILSIAGLPDTAAAVATSFADGTAVWQRPLSGMVLFAEPIEPGAPLSRFYVHAVDGTVLFEVWNGEIQPQGAVSEALAEAPRTPAAVIEVGHVVRFGGGKATDGTTLWDLEAGAELTRIDLASGETTGALPLGDEIGFVLADETLIMGGGTTMKAVDLGSMTVIASIPFPWDIVASTMTYRWLPIAVDSGLWLGERSGAGGLLLMRVDMTSGENTDRIELQDPLHGFERDGSIWVLGNEQVEWVDTETRDVTSTPLTSKLTNVLDVMEVDGIFWLLSNDDGEASVARIDPLTGSVLRAGGVGRFPDIEDTDVGPSLGVRLVAVPHGVWVQGLDDGQIAHVNGETLEVSRIPRSQVSDDAAAYGDELWTYGDGAATRLDPRTGETVEQVLGVNAETVESLHVTETTIWIVGRSGAVTGIPRR